MRAWLVCGAVNGFVAVAAGAFGAHGLKKILSPDMLEVFRTGAQYQMYHALALLALGLFAQQRPSAWVDASGYAMTTGIVLFSGSLYALAVTDLKPLGAITPFGGLCLLGGWLALVIQPGSPTAGEK